MSTDARTDEEILNPPPDLGACIEPDCTLDAVTTRRAAGPWVTSSGIVAGVTEWVCSVHDVEEP